MVVLSDHDAAYATSAQLHAAHEIIHRRYPSASNPVIKEFPHRGTFAKSKENLSPQRQKSIAYKHDSPRHKNTGSDGTRYSTMSGKAPTIVSSIVSPTVTRKPSIQQQRRYMMSKKEVKKKFFYPVGGPKRMRSMRRGKYRTKSELNASMDYIDHDNTMARDLCSNQYVKAFEIKDRDLIRMDPKLKEQVKVITVDSKNNYVIYTPDPTPGKNSVADAEKILNDELVKLGRPVTFNRTLSSHNNRKSLPVSIPEYRIIRPEYHRYDTFPITEKPALIRTHSLPTKFNDEKLEALWNLYLRRVIAARIKWRLTHSSQEFLDQTKANKRLSRASMVSSVDTGFFVSQQLQERESFPVVYKESPLEDIRGSSEDSIRAVRPPPPAPRETTPESFESALSTADHLGSPRRQAMLESLEQLMNDVTSVISTNLA